MKKSQYILIILLGSFIISHSQIKRDFRLLDEYEGVVKMSNYSSGDLFYKLSPIESNDLLYKYTLHIGRSNTDFERSFTVVVRNLLNSTYFEIYLKEEPKTILAAIYKKTAKWLRIKGVVPSECRINNAEWDRIDDIEDYNKLIGHIMEELDKNVDLACTAF